jgi:dTDP-4-dehydrorhamnose reductase
MIDMNKDKGYRILITGLNGVIGWNLFAHARAQHVVFGTYQKKLKVFEAPCFRRINIDNEHKLASFIKEADPHYVIHARAMCDLDVCELVPDLASQVNVGGTRSLLSALSEAKELKKLVYVSTDHVFSGAKGEYTEEDVPSPKHVFGSTKLEAENMIKASSFPYLIIRPGLLIADSVQGNVGPKDFLWSRLKKGKITTYFTDEWRTPISGQEFCERAFKAIFSEKKGILHIAGNAIVNRYELSKRIATDGNFSERLIAPGLRKNDKWAHIRPEKLTLRSRDSSLVSA